MHVGSLQKIGPNGMDIGIVGILIVDIGCHFCVGERLSFTLNCGGMGSLSRSS